MSVVQTGGAAQGVGPMPHEHEEGRPGRGKSSRLSTRNMSDIVMLASGITCMFPYHAQAAALQTRYCLLQCHGPGRCATAICVFVVIPAKRITSTTVGAC